VVKGKDKFIVECFVRPSKSMIKNKLNILKELHKKIIIVYPSHVKLKFKFKDITDEIKIFVPKEMLDDNTTITIMVSQEVWLNLVQRKKTSKETFDDVLRRELKIEEKKE